MCCSMMLPLRSHSEMSIKLKSFCKVFMTLKVLLLFGCYSVLWFEYKMSPPGSHAWSQLLVVGMATLGRPRNYSPVLLPEPSGCEQATLLPQLQRPFLPCPCRPTACEPMQVLPLTTKQKVSNTPGSHSGELWESSLCLRWLQTCCLPSLLKLSARKRKKKKV